MSCQSATPLRKRGVGCSPYRNISTFGSNNAPSNDPLTYCLFADIDKTLSHNPLGYQYGPASRQCQNYMAEYCSKDGAFSNGVCQLASSNENMVYPELGQVSPYGGYNNKFGNSIQGGIPYGKSLLRSSAQRRFLDLSGCPVSVYPFDPTVASSPMIKDYLVFYDSDAENPKGCRNGRCSGFANLSNLAPNMVDRDPLLNAVLDNYTICMDILKSICITIKLNNKLGDYRGTRLGKFCQEYFASFQ